MEELTNNLTIEPNKRLSFTELLYGILFQPRVTFKKVAETTPLFHAFLIFIGVNIINSLVGFFTVSESLVNPTLEGVPAEFQEFLTILSSPAVTFFGTIFSLIFSLLFWFFMAAVLSLLAEVFGGKGRGIGVLTVLGCATLPQILAVPFEVFFYITGLPGSLLTIVTIPLAIWSQLFLPILGLREVHKFSLGRAVLTVITPSVILFGLLVMTFFSFLSLLIPYLG